MEVMKLSIIHPSRSRPELANATAREWIRKSSRANIEYAWSLDSDDDWKAYASIFRGAEYDSDRITVAMHTGPNKSAIEAINHAVAKATGDILVIISDDFSCPESWDIELLHHLEGKTDFCAKAQDGIQPWMMTMPIMDRVYYERYGFVYNPAYQHMYCDLELSCVADLTGKKIDIPMLFPHKHYSVPGGIKKDAVTEKNDSTYASGEKIFLERAKSNFDLKDEDIVSGISADPNCYKWFKSKGLFV